ncbi:hypothetical protein [Fluviicola taffensis]|uniref:hypothetical protein n=1 Tax=Fluviicola taffensis TaxID=191579 RepID=UPI0031378F79
MIDNKPLEEQAENYIKSQLLKFDFNVLKPSFDKKGSDLIIVDNIEKQNIRLIKVQSKGRKISTKSTNVKIPKTYVQDDFILFIYTIDNHKNEACFLFLPDDMKQWKLNGSDFVLSFNENKVLTKYFKDKLLNQILANQIKQLLSKTEIMEYTSIIIDGIFLEKAIITTTQTFQKIWPDKNLIKPKLNEIIEIILSQYDRFKSEKKGINCYLIISDSFNLENYVTIDTSKQTFNTSNGNQVRTFINRTNEIIAFEVIEQIERLVNNHNLILVADDIIYESELNRFKDNGTEMILIKMNGDCGSNMFVHYKWGDIMYSIGIAIGLEKHEL